MKVRTLQPITYAANPQGSKHRSIPAGVIADIPEPHCTALLNDPGNKWIEEVKEEGVEIYETKEIVPEASAAGFTSKYDVMSWQELQKLAADLGITQKLKKKTLIEEIKRITE